MNQLDKIQGIISDSASVKSSMITNCLLEIDNAATLMINAVKKGHTIFWCGNGGSAADSQHMAAELMGGLRDHNRPAIASIALTTDSSFITAWTNDISYKTIFSRQIEGLGHAGDVLVAISTSGNSENVITGVNTARKMGMKTITLTGKSGGKLLNMGDINIRIPSDDTQRIQEGHLLAEHILCELIEASTLVD